jgi:hypothetical protein
VRPERIWEAVLGGVGWILNVLQEAPAVSWLSPSEDKNVYISRDICMFLCLSSDLYDYFCKKVNSKK